MKTTFPGVTRPNWWARDWVTTVLAGVPPVVASCVAAAKEHDHSLRFALEAVAVWLVLASSVKVVLSWQKDRKAEVYESARDLTGVLLTLYHIMKQHCRIGDSPDEAKRLRLTVHRVVGEEFEQCVDYVGGSGGPAGRRFSVRAGIAGHAAAIGKPVLAKRNNDNHAEFLAELADRWRFTLAEAAKVSHDRKSWMAVPIPGKNGPIAVLFLDSNEQDFFAPDVQNVVVAACQGLAAYVKMRYAS